MVHHSLRECLPTLWARFSASMCHGAASVGGERPLGAGVSVKTPGVSCGTLGEQEDGDGARRIPR